MNSSQKKTTNEDSEALLVPSDCGCSELNRRIWAGLGLWIHYQSVLDVQEGAIGESHNARTCCNLVTGAVAVAIPNSLNNASLDDIRRYLYLI